MNRWELSHGKAGVNAPSWLTFEIHQPYFNGGQSDLTVLHAKAAVLAARRFEQREPGRLRFGMTMPASYRQLLTTESQLAAYQVKNPADLPAELASPAWQRMSQAYLAREELDPVDRAGLACWLVAACLHQAVLDVVPADYDPLACRDQVSAVTQASRAIALFAAEGLSSRTADAYRCLADNPAPTMAHVKSVAAWGYLLARHAGDDSAAPGLLRRATELLSDIAAEITAFEHAILSARLAVRAVMHDERQRNFADASARLADAWQLVSGLSAADADDDLVLLEARRRLIDRRVEIAVRLQDRDAEQEAIEQGLAIDPWCVKIHMQAGQAAERAGDAEQALAQYLHAARLGPHGTAFALLRAADCARALGHAEFARVLNERAFRAAPRAAGTRDALVRACEAAGDQPLAEVTRQAAARDGNRPFASNWHYQMYGAYFNLGESRSPCLYARLPTWAFEAAARGERQEMNWQRLMPPAFRRNLVRESGLTAFAVSHPAELPERLRTPDWQTLCDWLTEFTTFDTERQHLIAAVVFRLGFGKLVLDLVPATPAADLTTGAQMRLQHWRDLVRYVNSVGSALAAPENSFAIGRLAACPVKLRFFIAAFAVIFHGRETRSIDEALAWRQVGAGCLAELLADPAISAFEKTMLESRFYRSVSYLPFLRRDHERLEWEMARTEELARAVPASTEYEQFLARENLRACLETRSKSCYAFGEYERGHALVDEVLAIDPYEPKSHIEKAQSLLMRDKPRQAADSFLRTARLGPVSTALGYASAADCLEKAGLPVLAEDCYLQALRLDPHAISAARGWAAVGPKATMGQLAAEYLSGLEAWGVARRAARAAG